MPNYNPTPKEAFLADADALKAHHVLVENAALRRAISVALAQYSRKQSEIKATDLGGAASCFLRMQGANELIDTFYNLAETVTAARTEDVINLPGQVRSGPARKG